MPGPNSAPNGDISLVDGTLVFHSNRAILKRDDERAKGRLFTGKTDKDMSSGKWARHMANRRARGDADREGPRKQQRTNA